MNIFVIDLDAKKSESLLFDDFPEFPKKLLDSLEKEVKILELKFKKNKFKETGGRHSVSSYNNCKPRVSNTADGGYSPLKDFNENYQYFFFCFLCEILKNYEKYLNMDYFNSNDSEKVTSIDTLFNCKKFIESQNKSDKPFYTRFIEDSQLFADFIYKRMIPRNNQEIIDVLFVNETIIRIKNRNKIIGTHKTEFLDSQNYKIVGKYVVPKPREVTKDEQKHLLGAHNKEYKKKGQIITKKMINIEEKEIDLLNNMNNSNINNNNNSALNDSIANKSVLNTSGQKGPNKSNFLKNFSEALSKMKSKDKIESTDNDIIKKNTNNSILSAAPTPKTKDNNNTNNLKEEINFNYMLFPELDFALYCNNDNVNDYYPPPDYSEEIEAVNNIVISKSSLGQNINKTLEMRNYIYLTWLEIWSFTFYYIEKNEREYRFNQMLDILDKVIHHEMNIFNLMFDILNQQNEQIFIFKLYQKLLHLKINPSTFIYNIISNILDKEQIKELIEETKKNKNQSLKFNINNNIISSFKPRTFLTESDKLLISSKLKFDSVFPCLKCGKKINLFNLCINYENVRNDILWVPCNCGEYNLPKINVKFGFELFPSSQTDKKKKNLSTCTTNEIVLHSPYNLKININNAVTTNYGNQLDINSFKNEYSALFWDFIWYCYINNLDHSIILPYLYQIEKLNDIPFHDTNKDILQVTVNNKLYKRNENVIYDIRANKNKDVKKVNFAKKFKILIQNKEISIEIGKLAKDRNKKDIIVFMDHLNKLTLKTPTSVSTIKNQNIKGISSQLKRVPTKRRELDLNFKFPEISMENVYKNNMNSPLAIGDPNNNSTEINDKRFGAFFKKNK